MQIINLIKISILTLLASIILAGCGGGGSDATFENVTSTIPVTMCNDATTPWTPLSSGDVVSTSNNTQLKFDHDSNGNKQVCVVSGSATVIRF